MSVRYAIMLMPEWMHVFKNLDSYNVKTVISSAKSICYLKPTNEI